MQRRRTFLRHSALLGICAIMLLPFYWVLKTAVTNENIYAYPPRLLPASPHLFNFVDVWYFIPFPRYLLNSLIVSALVVGCNIGFNAHGGLCAYQELPRQTRRSTAVPVLHADSVSSHHYSGLSHHLQTRAPQLLFRPRLAAAFDHRVHFRVQGGIRGRPTVPVDAARIDGLSEWRIILRILLPLSKAAIATNVVLAFIWSWNAFLWPLIITRDPAMQTLPLGLARFLSYLEDTTGALYAFAVMVLVPSIFVFLMAQKEFIRGLTSGATKG